MSYASDVAVFGEHVRHGGDWRYGLLVARWVTPGAGHGGDRRSDQVEEVQLEKVSPNKFAKDAEVSGPTVTKYYKAWQAAAVEGHVPGAESIDPGEDIDLSERTPDEWRDCYRKANKKQSDTPPDSGEGPAATRLKFKKSVGKIIEATKYDPDKVIEILGDTPEDYEYIEQMVMIVAQWLNQVSEARIGKGKN